MPATPPSPPGRFLFGHLGELRSDLLGFYTRNARAYGDVVLLRYGFKPVWVVSDPALIGEVLSGKGFIKHYALRMSSMLLGNGLLSSEGDFWLRQRRLIQPPFLRGRVLGHGAVMADIAVRHAARWRPGETRDIHAEMRGLTMAIAARTLFGTDVADGEGAAVAEALADVMAAFGDRLFSLLRLPEWFPTWGNVRSWFAIRRLDAILYGLIRRAKKDGPGDDLLSILLHARDEQGTGMTEKQLRDEAMTLFLAGHETTALALTYALYLLARHPEKAERLRAELASVLDGRPPGVEDLPRLTYTEQVVLEAMRLYPPAYAIGRQALSACELGGYPIPADGTIVMPQWVVHRDPRWWGEDAGEFRPERWTDEMQARLTKFAYFPFGGGPRVCVGNTFAMVEMVLVLAALAARWRFEYADAAEVRFRPRMTLGPAAPVRMVFHEAR